MVNFALSSRMTATEGPMIEDYVQMLARLLELAGVATILIGVLAATFIFLRQGWRSTWGDAYESFRANLGRSILLGLEFLVGADIISTIVAPLTLESVGLLALIIVIRTFLSFALETEIEGCWPWKRSALRATLDGKADEGR